MNNQNNINVKVLFLYFFLIWELSLLLSDNYIEKIIACLMLGFLFICFRRKICEVINKNYLLLKDIRKRKYFYITEEGYKKDLMKRREFGTFIFRIACLFVLLFIIALLPLISLYRFKYVNALLFILTLIAFVAIVINFRNYLTSLYYYIVPLCLLAVSLEYNVDLSTFDGILTFIARSLITYVVFTIMLSLPSLRKITRTSWMLGVLTTLLLPLVLEHVLPNMTTSMMRDNLAVKTITIEMLQNTGQFTDDVVETIKSNPILLEILNKFVHIVAFNKADKDVRLLYTIEFLCVSSYSIGALLINIKLRLGESKAKDIYKELLSNNVTNDLEKYKLLRDCVFYGGQKFEESIMKNSEYVNIINEHESSKEFYEEKREWILIPLLIVSWFNNLLKKCI